MRKLIFAVALVASFGASAQQQMLEWYNTKPAKSSYKDRSATCPTCLYVTASGAEATTITINWTNSVGPMTMDILWFVGSGSILVDCDTTMVFGSISATNGAVATYSLVQQQPTVTYSSVQTSDPTLLGTLDTVPNGCGYTIVTYISGPLPSTFACDSAIHLYGVGGYVHEMEFPVGSGMNITVDCKAFKVTDTVEVWGANGLVVSLVLGTNGPYQEPVIWEGGVVTVISGITPDYSPLTTLSTEGFGRIVVDLENNCALRIVVKSNHSSTTVWHLFVHCCADCYQPVIPPVDRDTVLCSGQTWLGNTITTDTVIAETQKTAGLCDSTTYWHIKVSTMQIEGFNMASNLLCNGDTNGQAEVLAHADNPFGIQWSTGDTTSVVSGLPAGTYTVTLTDSNGCTATDFVAITEPPLLLANVQVTEPTCFGYPNGELIASVSGGVPPYMAFWSNGVTTSANAPIPAGEYVLEVVDSNGCDVVLETVLKQPDDIQLRFTSNPASCVGIADGKAFVSATGGNGSFEYSWSNGDTGKQADSLFARHYYSVTATDGNGCIGTDSIIVSSDAENDVYAPNAFSPNGDNNNEKFMLYLGPCAIEVLELNIFDRFGDQVFAGRNLTDPAYGWDGMFRGKPMDPAVFTWFAFVRFSDGSEVLYEGDVTLVK